MCVCVCISLCLQGEGKRETLGKVRKGEFEIPRYGTRIYHMYSISFLLYGCLVCDSKQFCDSNLQKKFAHFIIVFLGVLDY